MARKRLGLLPKTIISFIILLLVATAGFLLAYKSAEEALRSEVIDNNRYTTQQISDRMQSVIDTSISTLSTLTQNTEFQSISTTYKKTGEIAGYKRLELRSMIKVMQRPPFEEVFLYVPSLDLIISTNNGAGTLQVSYNIYFPFDNRSYDEWKSLLSTYHLGSIEPYYYMANKTTVMLLLSISSQRKSGIGISRLLFAVLGGVTKC